MIIESAEYYRNKMHDCLDLAAQANHPSMKAAWLLVAGRLEKLAARIDADEVAGASSNPALSIVPR